MAHGALAQVLREPSELKNRRLRQVRKAWNGAAWLQCGDPIGKSSACRAMRPGAPLGQLSAAG